MLKLPAWTIALTVGVGLPVVGFLLTTANPALAAVLAIFGSGAAAALLLVPEMSMLLWLGASVVAGTAILLLHALLRAAIPAFGAASFLAYLLGTSALLGALMALILWRTRWPRTPCLWSRGDLIFVIALLPVLASTLAVSGANGYQLGPDGQERFLARGFVSGDTMTLLALTNAAGSRQEAGGSRLLRENPFTGNGPLEYPTLLHRALADLPSVTHSDMTRDAWILLIPVLIGTVAISVLSARSIFREQPAPWWAALVLLAAYGATWESFTYPQGHAFLNGLFFLFVLLLVLRDQSASWWERRVLGVSAGALALALLFSNAVLGTAAVAIGVGANVLQLFDRTRTRGERVLGILAALVFLLLFLRFPPGAGALGKLNVAYTAVPQFLTAAVLALLVVWALWDYRWLHRSPSLLGAAVMLPALAATTLIGSARDIVAENSPRFLFLLILVGWPALIPLTQRLADWWWREVKNVSHTVAEYAVLWGGGAFALFALLLPMGASVAGTLDHLVRKPPTVVSADELEAFAWVREHTPPDAVFLRAPESLFTDHRVAPLSLPSFTGRAQLRSEYWLSPEDAVFESVRRFFAGIGGIPAGASYLFCGPERASCPAVGRPVFTTGVVMVRELTHE